jgi:hypothetical protein
MSKNSSFLSVQYDALITALQNKPNYQNEEAYAIAKESRKCISNYSAKILYCLDDVGLLCASEVPLRLIGSNFSCTRLLLQFLSYFCITI